MKCTNKKSEISDHERGRISAAVVELLRHQIADRRLVVWYDPQKAWGMGDFHEKPTYRTNVIIIAAANTAVIEDPQWCNHSALGPDVSW